MEKHIPLHPQFSRAIENELSSQLKSLTKNFSQPNQLIIDQKQTQIIQTTQETKYVVQYDQANQQFNKKLQEIFETQALGRKSSQNNSTQQEQKYKYNQRSNNQKHNLKHSSKLKQQRCRSRQRIQINGSINRDKKRIKNKQEQKADKKPQPAQRNSPSIYIQMIGRMHFKLYYGKLRQREFKHYQIRSKQEIVSSKSFRDQPAWLQSIIYGKYAINITLADLSLIFIIDSHNSQQFVEQYVTIMNELLQLKSHSNEDPQSIKVKQSKIKQTMDWLNLSLKTFENRIFYGNNKQESAKQILQYLLYIHKIVDESGQPEISNQNQKPDFFYTDINQFNQIIKDKKLKQARSEQRYELQQSSKGTNTIKKADMQEDSSSIDDHQHQINKVKSKFKQVLIILKQTIGPLRWKKHLSQLKDLVDCYWKDKKSAIGETYFQQIVSLQLIFSKPIRLLWLVKRFPQNNYKHFWHELKRQ